MGVRCYQDLVAWQLANELKRKVYELIDNSSTRVDLRFRDQIRASASSAPTNIADGFGYYRHPDFARFVRIARAELSETHCHLGDGVDRRYWSKEEAEELRQLANRAVGATTGLLRYLMTTEAPQKWPKRSPSR